MLAHLGQVTDARVECCEEANSEVVAQAVAVRWAVDAKEDKGRKLNYETTSFGIKLYRVDSVEIDDLRSCRIAAYACIVGKLSVWRR
jgi:hypothetical protein